MINAEHYINGKPELYELPDWATTTTIPDDWEFLTRRQLDEPETANTFRTGVFYNNTAGVIGEGCNFNRVPRWGDKYGRKKK